MSRNIETLYDSIDNVTVSEAHVCTPENCLSYMNLYKSKKQIVIISQNIRSISKNLDDFLVLIKRTNIEPDIIVLTECWLSKCFSVPHLDGYESASTSNNLMQNDGVVVYTKTNIRTKSYEPSIMNANCLVTIINNDVAIISIYRSPSYSNIDNFIHSLDSTLLSLASFNNVVLLGDININIIDDEETRKSSDYLDVLAYHGLLPSHTYPTRKSSCLDHVILKTKQSALTLVIQNTLTDHNTILLALQNSNKKIYTPEIISKVDYEAIKAELSNIDFNCVLSAIDCNFATNVFVDILTKIIQKNTFFVKLSRRKTPIKPWITPGLIRCMRHRDKLHSKVRKSPDNESLKLIYKRYRNFCNSLLRKLKKLYDKTQFEKAGTDVRKTWKVINNITNYKPKKSLPQDLIQGNDPSTIINSVNDFFANIGKNLAEKVSLCGTDTPYILAKTHKFGKSIRYGVNIIACG
ncbi:putative tick transposon [Operophtera brumata]|uniref:Putative tick transposon n=1 Tax=Operophtera brumata TaxID=104452 RepID=A0A0L7KUG3_OPEBR|nr:putative tick transposon [Operophtera brumata]